MTTPELVARISNTLLAGLALAVLVWLVLRWFKLLNSGTRFAVWFSTLVGVVVLPFVSFGSGADIAARFARPAFVLPGWLAAYLFGAWGLISSVLLLRLGYSLLHMWKLRRNAKRLAVDELEPALRDVLAGSSRRVRILASDRVRVPAALGFFRPAIVIPRWALHDLPADELRTILLHELAHLRRWDDWTNLAQKIVKALFFFHPAVWWIESRMSLEREMACDDLVLAETPSPRAYATSLISLAERVGFGRTITLAQAALGRAHHTSLRIAQILDSKRPRGTRIWKPALGFGAAIIAVVLVAAPYSPDLVAFATPEPLEIASAVPAAPEVVPTASKDASRTAKAVKTSLRTRAKAELPIVVSAAEKRERVPLVVSAAEKRERVPQPQVVLVMQSTQFDEAGAPVFTLTVWQITDKDRGQVRTEIVMHSL